MKTSKLLFSIFMIGCTLSICGYSVPNKGPNFSVPVNRGPVTPRINPHNSPAKNAVAPAAKKEASPLEAEGTPKTPPKKTDTKKSDVAP